MRVLVLIDAFRMGGAETLLAPMAAATRRTDMTMDFVGLSPESMNAAKTMTILTDAGVTTRSLGIRRLLDPTAVPKLVSLIRDGRYDVVHAHLEMAITLAKPACTLTRTPLVCTFHHVAAPLEGRAAQRERLAVASATAADRALFVSSASRASFRKLYRPRRMPANWMVLHNGIDVTGFAPGPADPAVRARLGGSAGRPVVVLPAAFRRPKGISVAVDAWPRVLEQHPGAVLALVGGGELDAELRAQVTAAGLTDSVRFAGVRTDMPDIYRAADITVLPSTHENLPTVLIEASAAGCAVAATRVGGIPDIIDDGRTGLLFEPGDPDAFADAVIRLLDDPGLRTEMTDAALRRAREHFSADAWLARLRETYLDVQPAL